MQAVVPKHSPSQSNNSNNGNNGDDKGNENKMPSSRGDKYNNNIGNNNRLMEHLHNGTWKHHNLVAVQTRAPKYHEGQYRLNFSGRVLTPSVKNMQLENEYGECLLQFGKVDEENTFHLDYKVRCVWI